MLDRDKVLQPIKVQLSQKQKAFSEFFLEHLNFKHFPKKDDPHS